MKITKYSFIKSSSRASECPKISYSEFDPLLEILKPNHYGWVHSIQYLPEFLDQKQNI